MAAQFHFQFCKVHNENEPYCSCGLDKFIDTAIARAVAEKDAWWKTNDVARVEEIVRLREEVAAWQRDYRTASRAFEAMEQKLARAVEGERAWWMSMTDEDFPCIEAGRAKGSCKHESWVECLLDAAAFRVEHGEHD